MKMPSLHFARRACAFAPVALALVLLSGTGAEAAYPILFGTQEVHSTNLKNFPKWRGVVERFAGETAGCAGSSCNPGWAALLSELAGKDVARLRSEGDEGHGGRERKGDAMPGPPDGQASAPARPTKLVRG